MNKINSDGQVVPSTDLSEPQVNSQVKLAF